MRFWETGKSVCRMYGLGSWVFTCGCVPSCATQPSLHPLYPTLPACNVTIHNRCKDTLANCTKVKQKVRGQGGPRVGGEGRDRSTCLFFVHSLPCVSLPWDSLDLPPRLRPTVNIALPNYSVWGSLGDSYSWCLSLLCTTATESCSAEEQHCLAVCFPPK